MNPTIWTTPAGFVKLLLLLALFGLGGYLMLSARRRRGDSTAPHCLACGYNLTGLIGGRCPECGIESTDDLRTIGPPAEMHWGRFLLGACIVFGPAAWIVWDYIARNAVVAPAASPVVFPQ